MTKPSGSSAWYAEWFDRAEYDIVYKSRDAADARKLLATILRRTGIQPGAKVLDMACGRGRHAIELARRGFRVTGVDLSSRAIETAREEAVDQGLDIDFEIGDMRESICSSCFDLVLNLFTSFGYFEDDVENARAVVAMADAVDRDGWLVQDFMNGPYWAENFVPYDERSEDGILLQQRRWVEDGRLNKEITIVDPDHGSRSYTESVRLFGSEDLVQMHRDAGLDVQFVLGDSGGSPFEASSKRLIVFSKRPATS